MDRVKGIFLIQKVKTHLSSNTLKCLCLNEKGIYGSTTNCNRFFVPYYNMQETATTQRVKLVQTKYLCKNASPFVYKL